MRFVSSAWRRVFSHEERIETRYDGQLLPFAVFAACRILQVTPSTQAKGPIYKALFEIAKSYIKADVPGISNCITKYKISALMDDLANTPATCGQNLEILKHLMWLLEKLLLEYLSHNWDSVEDVLLVNREADLNTSESYASLSRLRNSSSTALVAKERARKNWQRAYRVAIKQIVMETFGVKRTVITMKQLFTELSRGSSASELSMSQALDRRAPILLLLGGGMAAGKTSVRQVIGSDEFWSKVGKDAVVVEADAIKNQDIVFQTLKDRLGDDPSISQLVHEYSTKAAEGMLVSAVNDQKDIVFDGTMTWLPFVEQTVAMVRDHEHNYRNGPGYYQDSQGVVHEKYWEIDPDAPVEPGSKVPYRIEFVGVTCDPALAVARGIWRQVRTGRGVPVKSQLRSHRLFSQNFEGIAKMVDSATLYHTGSNLTTFTHCEQGIISPKVICHASSVTRGELLVNPRAMKEFSRIQRINDLATCKADLYAKDSQNSDNGRYLERSFTQSVDASPTQSLRHKLMQAHKISSIDEDGQ